MRSPALHSLFACLLLFIRASAGDLRDCTNRADYLVVAPAAYIATAETLASFRSLHNGLVARVVPVESVLVQFGRELPPDQALKSFLRYALTQWRAPRPQFILLAGNVNTVPSHAESVDLGLPPDSAMVDQWFVEDSVEDGKAAMPLASIGRLPAWDPAALSIMVAKTIDYESQGGASWLNRVLSLADRDSIDGSLYEHDASLVLQQIPGAGWTDTLTVHTWTGSPSYRDPAQFRTLWNSGAGIVCYNGHGGTTALSRSRYFTTWDVDSLDNAGMPSVCLFGACNQRIEARSPSSIPVHLLERAGGGAVAVIAPGGLTYESTNSTFFHALIQAAADSPGEPLGCLFRRAMEANLFGAWRDSVSRRMNFLGDPALTFRRALASSVDSRPSGRPVHIELSQNYPNPFNPSTTIRYGVPTSSRVTLAVFNALGQQVKLLQDDAVSSGYHEVRFMAYGLASGVYYYRLSVVPLESGNLLSGQGDRGESAGFVQTRSLVLLK